MDEIIRGPGERLAAYRPPRFGEGSVSTALHLGPLAATRRESGFNAICRPLDPDSRPEGSRRRVRRGAYSVGLDIAPNLIGQCAGIRRTRSSENEVSVVPQAARADRPSHPGGASLLTRVAIAADSPSSRSAQCRQPLRRPTHSLVSCGQPKVSCSAEFGDRHSLLTSGVLCPTITRRVNSGPILGWRCLGRQSPDDLCAQLRERSSGVADTSQPGAVQGDPSTPEKRQRPKRGAFPTPKSEIENANPYIPDVDKFDECEETERDLTTDVSGEEGV